MAKGALEKNRDFIFKNKEKLLKTYQGKYIVVLDEKVTGAYDNYETAVEEAIRMHGKDSDFLVHHLTKIETVNFVVRAAF